MMSDALPTHVAIVANPYSGAKSNARRVEALLQAIQAAGLTPVPMWEQDALLQATPQADFAHRYRSIIAAGGDGTLHHVINTLGPSSTVPVVMFPLGTENLFARQFQCTGDPVAMAQMVVKRHTAQIDLGQLNGRRLFPLVASAGFDAEVIHRLHAWRQQKTGKLRRVRRMTYLRPIAQSLFGYRYPQVHVEADGRKLTGSMCMVFNLPQYGMGLNICPTADGTDGLLDYIVFGSPGMASLVAYATSIKLGRLLKRSNIQYGRAKTLRLTCEQSVPMELDGEEAGFAPATIECLPAALRVLVHR